MSASSSGEVVTAFLSAIERRELDVALEMVSDDVEYDNVPIGKVAGPEGIRRVLSNGVLASADRLEWIIVRQAAEGGLVLNERLDRFHLADRWVEVPVAGVFEVRDGRIALWRDYFDLPSVVRQLATPDL